MPRVLVRLDDRSYPIEIGRAHVSVLRKLLRRHVGYGRVFALCDAKWYALHGVRFFGQLSKTRLQTEVYVLPDGERTKSAQVLAHVYDYLLSSRIARDDFILACGGGVVSDLAGYAAATTLRGLSWGVVPTTLVGMVDAAIGGKTGINHRSGKNLIGAIWQPKFVWTNLDYLHTLPKRHLVAGMGEILKTAGLAGGPLLVRFARFLDRGIELGSPEMVDLVVRTTVYKAGLLAKDERDLGKRMFLNYGHTFGHAIERALGYGALLHGEAVILGIAAALELAETALKTKPSLLSGYAESVDRMVALVPRRQIELHDVIQAMSLDKKRAAQKLRFILLKAPGRPVIVDAVSASQVSHALRQMLSRYQDIGGTDGKGTGR
ncbi:MAG: 3-dehydroquinate synthase family protein [Candidatus Zixiibacteriota bacterium]